MLRLEIPCERRFVNVARLVIGGLATRIDLSFEALDDLQVALETVLAYEVGAGDEHTTLERMSIEVAVLPKRLVLEVGPLRTAPSSTHVSLGDEELEVSQLLARLVDDASVLQRDQQPWVRLEKHTPVRAGR